MFLEYNCFNFIIFYEHASFCQPSFYVMKLSFQPLVSLRVHLIQVRPQYLPLCARFLHYHSVQQSSFLISLLEHQSLFSTRQLDVLSFHFSLPYLLHHWQMHQGPNHPGKHYQSALSLKIFSKKEFVHHHFLVFQLPLRFQHWTLE